MKQLFLALAAASLASPFLAPLASAQEHADPVIWSKNSTAAIIEIAHNKGYTAGGGQFVDTARLRQGKVYDFNMTLRAGETYLLQGVCGIMCQDMQVQVMDGDRQIALKWDGPQPAVEFSVPADGNYQIGMTMGHCNSASDDYQCPGAFGIFPKSGPPKAESAAEPIKVTDMPKWQTTLRDNLIYQIDQRGYNLVAGAIEYERAMGLADERTRAFELNAGQKYLVQGWCAGCSAVFFEVHDPSGAWVTDFAQHKQDNTNPWAEFVAPSGGVYTVKLRMGLCSGPEMKCDAGAALVFDPNVKPVAVAAAPSAPATPKAPEAAGGSKAGQTSSSREELNKLLDSPINYDDLKKQFANQTPLIQAPTAKPVAPVATPTPAASSEPAPFDPLAVYIDNAISGGWTRVGEIKAQDLKDGARHAFTFKVDRTKKTLVAGECEHGCGDVTFSANDFLGRELDYFIGTGASPRLNVDPGQTDLTVYATAKSCTAEECRFGVGVYQK